MYDDDATILLSSDNIENIDAVVNAEHVCLEKWLKGNKISLNVVKTQAMIIGSLQKLRKIDTPTIPLPHFQVNGNNIVTSSGCDTPPVPLFQQFDWLTIQKMIIREAYAMAYKSLYELAAEKLGNIFEISSNFHTRALRNTKCSLARPKMRTAYGQKSFAINTNNISGELNDILTSFFLISF